MTREDKELLLKDLCARLPYGVKVQCGDHLFTFDKDHMGIGMLYKDFNMNLLESPKIILSGCYYGEDIKPYLFPLSSITIEQEKELSKLGVSYGEYALHDDIRGLGIMVDEAYIFFEFCYKHHIDFLGLIEKGLAIDATRLNIY